jgi:hypothetical protein
VYLFAGSIRVVKLVWHRWLEEFLLGSCVGGEEFSFVLLFLVEGKNWCGEYDEFAE